MSVSNPKVDPNENLDTIPIADIIRTRLANNPRYRRMVHLAQVHQCMVEEQGVELPPEKGAITGLTRTELLAGRDVIQEESAIITQMADDLMRASGQ